MGSIITSILSAALPALQSLLGPVLAYFTGRAQGRAAAVAEQTAETARIVAAEQVAAARAPQTQSEVVATLRDASKRF